MSWASYSMNQFDNENGWGQQTVGWYQGDPNLNNPRMYPFDNSIPWNQCPYLSEPHFSYSSPLLREQYAYENSDLSMQPISDPWPINPPYVQSTSDDAYSSLEHRIGALAHSFNYRLPSHLSLEEKLEVLEQVSTSQSIESLIPKLEQEMQLLEQQMQVLPNFRTDHTDELSATIFEETFGIEFKKQFEDEFVNNCEN